MVSKPQEGSSDEVAELRETKGRGRLRLGILLAALLTLTAYAAVTDSFNMPPKRQHRQLEEITPARLIQAAERRVAQRQRPQTGDNGFDLSNATIPTDEILRGGPPRDGIPAIDEPKFLPVSQADFLRDADQVLGFVQNGEARAYPLRILVQHEIVNDTVGGRPIAVTYCPLCGTCMVFDRRYAGEELTFGVSGLLYNSDVLMYDRQTESLWSQLKMEAVAGPQVGQKMHWLASEQMTWAAWKKRYPDSEVLSRETGFRRDYNRFPYAGYESTERTMFPVAKHRDELKNKEWVIGVVVDGTPKAYPVAELEKLGDAPFDDVVGGLPIKVSYDATSLRVEVKERASGTAVPNVRVYWFAWQAFYPETELYGHD